MTKKAQVTVAVVAAVLAYVLVSTYPKWMPFRWQEFSSPEGRFAVLMPGVPEATTEVYRDRNIEMHMFTLDRGSSAFMASYFELGPTSTPPDVILDGARAGSIRKVEGALLSEEKLTLDGHPGREFKSTARGNQFVDTRMYLVDQRLYLPTAVHPDRESSDVPKFFSSFKILPTHP